MCGVCGFAYRDRERVPEPDVLDAMLRAIEHRGPDASGVRLAPGVALGHRRLSVIDLVGGVQPMADPNDRTAVTYNGEIYNFLELRKELASKGWRFLTNSDTEVLLAGYKTWGLDVLDRLDGMFAFAIWDDDEQKLLLVRDRLGVKPMYWATVGTDGIAFSSELTSLIQHPAVERRLDRGALARYLAFGHIPGDDSLLAGIHRLSPGTYLTWSRPRGRVETGKFWCMAKVWRAAANHARPAAESGQVETFAGVLADAVKKRLVSDVPLGAFLSGGLDSSTVVALMSRHHRDGVETFSIGFDEDSFDESPWARRVAAELGCNHHERRSAVRSPELLIEIADKLDEPLADTSIIPTYVLCKMARERITVALSGDGGDELLAGYVTHRADRYRRLVGMLGPLIPKMGLSLLRRLPQDRSKVSLQFKARQFLDAVELDAVAAHASWRKLAGATLLAEILADSDAPRAVFDPYRRAFDESEGLNPLDRMLYVDYRTWLVDDILVKVDRASMAHGLEVRSPFLDRRLFELCAGLSPNLKLGWRHGKEILRHMARGVVPDFVLRRSKSGFNAPVAEWVDGSWRELVDDTLASGRGAWAEVLRPDVVVRLLGEHRSGWHDHGHLLFAILLLDRWLSRVCPAL